MANRVTKMSIQNDRNDKEKDRSYEGLTEYEVKDKSWQLLTMGGEVYVKKDLAGNFINQKTGEVVSLDKLFRNIRNFTNAEGIILATRKRKGRPLYPQKKRSAIPQKRKSKMPMF